MPDLYEKWKKKYPQSAELFGDVSNVGRTAYVSTLPDGNLGDGWTKEGEWLTTDNFNSILFNGRHGSKKNLTVKVKVDDEMTVKVCEGMKTDKNTKYVD